MAQLPSMRSQPGAGIVFDTALSRIDDALALALLYGLDGKHTVRVVAITVDRASLPAAARFLWASRRTTA